MSAMNNLQLPLNERRVVPNLQGVTGSPLRVIGSVRINLAVGFKRVITPWVPVVPDNYLTTDLLLGVDVLGYAPLKWDAPNRCVEWGDAVYPIRHKHQATNPAKSVKRVKSDRVKRNVDYPRALRVTSKIAFPPKHNQPCYVKTKEQPGTTLLVEPYPRPRQLCFPYVVRVRGDQHIV